MVLPTRVGRPEPRGPRLGPRTATPWLLAAWLVLTGTAWLMAMPPGTPPDEGAHYVKALGAGGGDLYGSAPSIGPAAVRSLLGLSARERANLAAIYRGRRGQQARWQNSTSRRFAVPAGLGVGPFAFLCTAGRPDVSARCLDGVRGTTHETRATTYTGTYQPYVYVLPGLLMRSTDDVGTAMRLGRVGSAAVAYGLLVLAGVLLWDRSRAAVALVGLFGAISPAVVYFASSLNPSGPEMAAGICFCASLLRLSRGEPQPRWVWAAAAISGVVLAIGRSLGPAFLITIAIAVVLLAGPRPLAAVARTSSVACQRWPRAPCCAASSPASRGRWRPSRIPHDRLRASAREILPAFGDLGSIGRQAVGVFGALDTSLPWVLPIAWGLLIAATFAAAATVADARTRRAMVLIAGLVLMAVIAVSVVYSRTGFDMQGRYVFPLLVILPLTAGEALRRGGERVPAQWATALLIAAAGGGRGHPRRRMVGHCAAVRDRRPGSVVVASRRRNGSRRPDGRCGRPQSSRARAAASPPARSLPRRYAAMR